MQMLEYFKTLTLLLKVKLLLSVFPLWTVYKSNNTTGEKGKNGQSKDAEQSEGILNVWEGLLSAI
jgi:hypothetical protein